jgi:DNA-binding response OmpR family regulator
MPFTAGKPGWKKSQLFIVSAISTPSDVINGLDAGAAMHLSKPVACIELKMVLELNIGLPV